MFTGIIQAMGKVAGLRSTGPDTRVQLETGTLDMSTVGIGDSIAVNGVCLTVISKSDTGFAADVSGETLSLTTFGLLREGDRVNLEKALTPATPLGGHLVSGHVDGIGRLLERREEGRSVRMRIEAPMELARYIARKGSVCIDGVSLTVNAVDGATFDLNLVPHTLQETTLQDYTPGRQVNIEVDLIARYLERLLLGDAAAAGAGGAVSEDLLREHGYLDQKSPGR